MTTILGIDAAWTAGQPSGVALIGQRHGAWICIAVAPSYPAFIALSRGQPVNWAAKPTGGTPDPITLLSAARTLAGTEVNLVTIDMPISTAPITCRRASDDAVSREFGGRGCSTHTPGTARPGILGAELSAGFTRRGYPIATITTRPGIPNRLLEVYPHTALLALLHRPSRVPYKASNSSKYWPGTSIPQRIARLTAEFARIHQALTATMGTLPLVLPPPEGVSQLSTLKRYEDALDALVCCWVGMLYVDGAAIPMGDAASAIWCPTSVVRPGNGNL